MAPIEVSPKKAACFALVDLTERSPLDSAFLQAAPFGANCIACNTAACRASGIAATSGIALALTQR